MFLFFTPNKHRIDKNKELRKTADYKYQQNDVNNKMQLNNLFADMQQASLTGYRQSDNIETQKKLFTIAQYLFQKVL